MEIAVRNDSESLKDVIMHDWCDSVLSVVSPAAFLRPSVAFSATVHLIL